MGTVEHVGAVKSTSVSSFSGFSDTTALFCFTFLTKLTHKTLLERDQHFPLRMNGGWSGSKKRKRKVHVSPFAASVVYCFFFVSSQGSWGPTDG